MKPTYFLFAVLALILLTIVPMQAATIAYADPADTGNEAWTGNLGEDFTVNSPITITALGVYDSGQGPINGDLEVAIFSSSGTQETPAEIFTGPITSYTLIGGDVFQTLTAPITLGPGNYSLTTTGWSSTVLNGNANAPGYTPPTLNTGGGAITFSGIGYSTTPGLVYLAPVSPYPANQFNAGSFQFTTSPEPATLVGVALGLIGLLAFRRQSVKG